MCVLCEYRSYSMSDGCVDAPEESGFIQAPASGTDATSKPWFSTTQITNQLTGNLPLFTGNTITYSISRGTSAWAGDNQADNYVSMSTTERNWMRESFELWDDVINVNLSETSSRYGDIRVHHYSYTDSDGDAGGTFASAKYSGSNLNHYEIWINEDWGSQGSDGDYFHGSYGVLTQIHEVGHTLGISHPGAYDASDDDPVTYSDEAEYRQDTRKYTVMSYFNANADGSGTDHWGSDGRWYHAQTPLIHDILAAQANYGADTTTRATNTVYGFGSTAGRTVFDFTVNDNPVIAIWDAGGYDTIDVSGWDSDQHLDLRAGQFSSVGAAQSATDNRSTLQDNLSIAYNVTIEKGVTGDGDDRVIGNNASNRLETNGGDDVVSGLGGNDSINTGAGDDVVYAGSGNDYVYTLSGDDRVYGESGDDVIYLYDGDDIAYGGSGDDRLYGHSGDDFLDGDSGNDELYGSTGRDRLYGGTGNDTLRGGDDRDVLYGEDGVDRLYGEGDNDSLYGGAGYDYHYGGAGNDYIQSGTSYTGGDTAGGYDRGDDGNDRIYGSDGAESLYGDNGADFIVGNGGNDYINGGAGVDSVSYIYATGAVNANLTTGSASGADGSDTLVSIENLYGSNHNDTLIGNGGTNTIIGYSGNDRIAGGLGTDNLYGYSGNDYIYASNLYDSDGSESIGADYMSGGDGNDYLYGSDGANRMYGGSGDDFFIGNGGADTLNGGAGTDRASYYYATGAVTVNLMTGVATGADGSDRLYSIEDVYGSNYGDRLTGDNGANYMSGGSGGDRFYATRGADTYSGGSGTDTADYSSATGSVNVNLSGATDTASVSGWTGSHRLYSIENITGSQYSDTIRGDSGYNYIIGGDGDDYIAGYGGSGYLLGFAGNDRIFAGAMYDYDGDSATSSARLYGYDGRDYIYGSDSAETIRGGNGDDFITANAGNDYVYGDAGVDTLSFSYASGAVYVYLASGYATGADGYDRLYSIENINGSNHNDYIYGDAADNRLNGGGGADRISGGDGNDVLIGAGGRDTIFGGAGDDVITSGTFSWGSASDGGVIYAGAGNDRVFGDDGYDVIRAEAGDDFVRGNGGNDYLDGGAGVDTADYSQATAGVQVYLSSGVAYGGDGADRLYNFENVNGSRYDDTLFGDDGANILDGGAGADHMRGYGGDDTLMLNAGGDDIIWGDHSAGVDGSDTFVVTDDAGGAKRIIDFNLSATVSDTLDFTDFDSSLADLDADVAVTGYATGVLMIDATLLVGEAFTIRIDGFTGQDLSSVNSLADFNDYSQTQFGVDAVLV